MINYDTLDYEALKKRGFLRSKEDGLMTLRTRKIGGHYTPDEFKVLAEIAEQFGRGIIHLTTRQGAEIPFIPYDQIAQVEQLVQTAGMKVGTSGPRLRATTACPGVLWCKRSLVDTFSLSKRLEEETEMVCGLDLPHKFKIVISGCPNTCTRAQCSEIGLHGAVAMINKKKKIGYAVYLAGCGGRQTTVGFKLDGVYSEDEVLRLIPKVVQFFKKHAKPHQRLASLVAEVGKDFFLREIDSIV